MILTVTLNPAIDLYVEVESIVWNDVNRARDARKSAGGKGINVSRVLREFGAQTSALTIVGSDSVHEFRRLAHAVDFTITYICIPGEMRTNIHIVDGGTAQFLKVNQAGAAVSDDNFEHFMMLFRQQARTAGMVALGGSLPPGLSPGAYARIAQVARDFGLPVLVDAEGEALVAALKQKPLIAKPNRRELSETFGEELKTKKQLLRAARELQRLGARGVVVTDGPRAALGLWDGEVWLAQPPRITPNHTTGAGDSLAAGLMACLEKGDEFSEALRMGMAAGAASCIAEEGRLARAADIKKLCGKVVLERVE